MLVAPWGSSGDSCLTARGAVQTTSPVRVRPVSPQKSPVRQRRPPMLFQSPDAVATGFESAPPTRSFRLPDASTAQVAASDCWSLSQSPSNRTTGRQATPSRWPPTPVSSCNGEKDASSTPSASSTSQLGSIRKPTYQCPSCGQMGLADAQSAAKHCAPCRAGIGADTAEISEASACRTAWHASAGANAARCPSNGYCRPMHSSSDSVVNLQGQSLADGVKQSSDTIKRHDNFREGSTGHFGRANYAFQRGGAVPRLLPDSEELLRVARRSPNAICTDSSEDSAATGISQATLRSAAAAVEAQSTVRSPSITRNHSVRSYTCHRCGLGGFADAQSAARHCNVTAELQETGTRDIFATEAVVSSPHHTSCTYKCPSCAQGGFLDARSAANHCALWRAGHASSTRSSAQGNAEGLNTRLTRRKARKSRSTSCIGKPIEEPTSPTSPTARLSSTGQTTESCNARAKQKDMDPVKSKIQRYIDQDTGQAQTVVYNGDGSRTAFGETSVCSLVSSCDEDVNRLMDRLSDLELQGLVHELNQRTIETSQLYERRQDAHEKLSELCDLAFFGLDWGATVKALDKAYKQLAKKMHPDRNGSTKEANDRFQEMKERYERLRKKLVAYWQAREQEEARRKKESKPRRKLSDSGLEELKRMAAAAAKDRKQGSEEAGADAEQIEKPTSQENDSKEQALERDELHKACWKMLRRTKTLQEKLVCINDQIVDLQQELAQLRGKRCNSQEVPAPET